jgi:hypothetical protein
LEVVLPWEVVSSFIASGSYELTVRPGDQLDIIEMHPSGWVYGTNLATNRKGWAPCWIVEAVRVERNFKTAEAVRVERNFKTAEAGELPVHTGDFVRVSEYHASGWMHCRTVSGGTNKIGWLPNWALARTPPWLPPWMPSWPCQTSSSSSYSSSSSSQSEPAMRWGANVRRLRKKRLAFRQLLVLFPDGLDS